MASQLAEENRQLKPKVESLRATVAQGRQQDLARAQELEGKYLCKSIVGFFQNMLLIPCDDQG
jgi:hypothetical protein